MIDVRPPALPRSIGVLDTHTEGEPTRVVLKGWPIPPGGTMAERREAMRRDQDALRRGVVLEPRGHEAMVGALLTPPVSEGAAAGVVFFNNVGYLGMCGHGLMGVVRALEHLGRIEPGRHRFDTPAGTVEAELLEGGRVRVRNVPAFCERTDVVVEVARSGLDSRRPSSGPDAAPASLRLTGDIAYGGNWFFIAHADGLSLGPERARELTQVCAAVLDTLDAQGIRGRDGAPIDHVELSGPPTGPHADARNFVLCPGGEFDRSPCGTGTSAMMAVRHHRGVLRPGERWRQEGISGGVFTGWLEEAAGPAGGATGESPLVPWLEGSAYVTGRAELLFDPADPFRAGIHFG